MDPGLELELRMARVLVIGVRIAALLVTAGAALLLWRHGMETISYHLFLGEPAALLSLPAILASTGQGHGRALIQLGLICLVLTPVVRVAMASIVFAGEKDYVYVCITAFVLFVLLYALVSER
jgi:uncharacterized membrane protein